MAGPGLEIGLAADYGAGRIDLVLIFTRSRKRSAGRLASETRLGYDLSTPLQRHGKSARGRGP